GQHIIYNSAGENQFAWRIRVDGRGEPEQLTDVPTSRILMSPDGRWLLARLRSPDGSSGPLWRTALWPADESAPATYFPVPTYGAGPQFEWRPDSKAFFFIDSRDGAGNVWEQPIDRSAPRQITSFGSGEIFAFDVSRDGRSLVLSRGEPTSDAVLVRNWR
ncbi:MAG TPA: hypothetical protein VFT12_09755, partial [Thermoanaerobaculia bacterium]|nr:hypothetical protein [Thermoanaerobaculia bacterium]